MSCNACKMSASEFPVRVTLAASFLVSFLAANSALASGFLNPRLADPHGHPALANPYAIYFNPGALGGVEGTQIVIDGTLAYRHATFDRAASALSPADPATRGDPTYIAANTGEGSASNVLVIPFVAAATDFGTQNFFGGLGAYVPFGGAVEWDRRDSFAQKPTARGAVDGTQRWAVVSGDQKSLYLTAAAGFRLPDAGLSIGLSGSLVLSSINHGMARNVSGSDEIGREGRALLEVSGVEGGFAVGAYWEPIPKGPVRIGASYTSSPGLGRMRLTGKLHQTYASQEVIDADLLQTYPDVIRFGIAARVSNQLELRFDSEYVRWSRFETQCIVNGGKECELTAEGAEANTPQGQIILAIPRYWNDAGAVHLGLGYWPSEPTELFASVGYDTSAANRETLEATYPDSLKLLGTLGVRHKLGDRLALGASYTYVHYLPRTVGPQFLSKLPLATRMPNEDGDYKSGIMFLNLNATLSF
jgi:long-chain fatty acid transport protein